MMEQAHVIQLKLEEHQKKIDSIEICTESGGGDVKIKTNGRGIILKLSISQDLLKKENKSVIEDLIIVAFNNAKKICEKKVSEIIGTSNNILKDMGMFF